MNKSSKCQAPSSPQDRQGFMIANLSQRDIFKVKKAADLLAEAKRKRNLLRGPVSEDEVIAALGDAAGLWEFMFPGARHELLQLIVGDIVVYPDRISFVLKVDGLKNLIDLIDDFIFFDNREHPLSPFCPLCPLGPQNAGLRQKCAVKYKEQMKHPLQFQKQRVLQFKNLSGCRNFQDQRR